MKKIFSDNLADSLLLCYIWCHIPVHTQKKYFKYYLNGPLYFRIILKITPISMTHHILIFFLSGNAQNTPPVLVAVPRTLQLALDTKVEKFIENFCLSSVRASFDFNFKVFFNRNRMRPK